jgi:lipopolysaccharide heptosyltransferase I
LKKILIIKMSALGDVLMALPHVDAILSHHPDDNVYIITSPPFRELFIHHPRLNVVLLDRKKKIGRENTYTRVLWVRRQGFNSVYDLQGNRISRLIVRFSQASRRVGTQPRNIYNFHPKQPYVKDTQQNVFARLNETIVSAGLLPAATRPELYVSEEDRVSLLKWQTAKGIKDGWFALMHAGSSPGWSSKQWPEKYFVELAQKIETLGIMCIWIGSNDDRQINDNLAKSVGLNVTGELSIMQLYQLGKGAIFAVTNDSGPMHILAASGLPVYSFFGPTNWIRSHALGQSERVFKSDCECSPCFLGQCPPHKDHECLDTIKPEGVFQKIRIDIGN